MDEVLNVSQAARVAGVSRQAVMKALRTGRLAGTGSSPPSVASGELRRWMAARAAPRTPGPAPAAAAVGEDPPADGSWAATVAEQARAVAGQSMSIATLLASQSALAGQVEDARRLNERLRIDNARLADEVGRLKMALRAQGRQSA